jgi:hypothetical protein
MLEQILSAIRILQYDLNCNKENLVICFDTITKQLLIRELSKYQLNMPIPHDLEQGFNKHSTLFGVSINPEWPYSNEVVIYDKKRCYLNPNLIIKLTLT